MPTAKAGNYVAPNKKRAHEKAVEVASKNGKVGSLHNKAMLCGLTIRLWSPSKLDKVMTSKVLDIAKAKDGTYVTTKRLLLKTAMAELKSLEGQMRQEHYFRTLPWGDDGYRVLSAAGYFKYQEEMNKLIAAYNKAADEFEIAYPQHIKDAQIALGDGFNPSEYPPPNKIRDRFSVYVTIRPIPAAEDFRIDVGDAALEVMKQQNELQSKAFLKDAMTEAFQRLREVVEHAVEQLKEYDIDKDGRVSNPFRDSIILNVRKMLKIVPTLNIADDPSLVKFAEETEKVLASQYPDELRSDNSLRAQVISQTEEMLAKMGEYFV